MMRAILSMIIFWGAMVPAWADTPLVYEGYLVDTNNDPVNNPSLPVTFELVGYTGSTPCVLSTITPNVNIVDGHFSATLNFADAFFGSAAVSGSPSCSFSPQGMSSSHKLRITIGGDVYGELFVGNAPKATNAQMLSGKAANDFVQTSASITQSNLESVMSRYTNLNSILNGTYPGLGTLATMSPTGTASGTTYLRGDGTWATMPAAPVTSVNGQTGAVVVNAAGLGLGDAATKNVGTAAGTVAAGDDPRFSDQRAPTAHTHNASDINAGTLPVTRGGTGSSSLSANQVILSNPSGTAFTGLSLCANGEVLGVSGGVWSCVTPSGGGGTDNTKLPLDGSVAMTGALQMAGNDVTNAGHITMGLQKSLRVGSYSPAQQNTLTGGLNSGHQGTFWYNTSRQNLMLWNGSDAREILSFPSPSGAQDGQALKWNNTTQQWEYFTPGAAGAGIASINGLSDSAQSLAVNTTGSSLAWTHGSATHTLSIPLANQSGVTAGLISKAQFDSFNSKMDSPTGASGNFMKYSGSTWYGAAIQFADVKNSLGNSAFNLAGCGPGKTVAWTSLTDTMTCESISITKSQVSDFPALGDAATKNVGTAAGTVAAGNHTHTADQISNASGKYFTYKPGNSACASGQTLIWSVAQERWECGAAGGVTAVTGTLPISVSGGASPVVSIATASTSAAGVVTLAASGDTSAGKVVQGNDSRLNDKREPASAYFSKYVTITADTTLTSLDIDHNAVYNVTATANITLTLPLPTKAGFRLEIKKTSSTGTVTIEPNGKKIDGSTAPLTLTNQYSSIALVWIGSTDGWIVQSRYDVSLLLFDNLNNLLSQPVSVDNINCKMVKIQNKGYLTAKDLCVSAMGVGDVEVCSMTCPEVFTARINLARGDSCMIGVKLRAGVPSGNGTVRLFVAGTTRDLSFGGTASAIDACTGTTTPPVIGDVCQGGTSRYAGTLNGRKYIVMPSAEGSQSVWSSGDFETGTVNNVDRPLSVSDGALSTTAIATFYSDPSRSTPQAIKYCYNLSRESQVDWFLPAPDEFDLFAANKAALSLEDTSYWTSYVNSSDSGNAVSFNMADQVRSNSPRNNETRKVICARTY
ncbi:MAG: hypothetical protein KF865_05785 [Bdellovibrionaceae bacterium]|nr:hypothetical protein [Pseudobdellovibrionaceae bacterium]